MKVSYPIIYLPSNSTEEAAVPTGALVVKSGETEVKLKTASGIEIVTSVGGQTGAVALKTVNGASLLGAGNVALAADLPGGTTATALDDGLGSGNATIDRATVAGQTILRYTTTGAITFTPPTGVTVAQVLVVAGGAGGDLGTTGAVHGHGGGGGRVAFRAALAVTPGTAVTGTVGIAGAVAAALDAQATAGGNSTFGTITATGGTQANNIGASGDGGDSGSDIEGVITSYAGGTDSLWGGAGGAGAGGASVNAVDTGVQAGGTGYASSISGASVTYGVGGNGIVAVTGNEPAAVPVNTGNGGHGRNPGALSGAAGTIIVRFATQSRSYQALTSYADNAAALAGGRLVGQFYRSSATSAVMQVQ